LLAEVPSLLPRIKELHGVPFLFHLVLDANANELREMVNLLEQQKSGFYFYVSVTEQKVVFYTSVGQKYVDKISFDALAAWLSDTFGMRGGVRKNTLQGGSQKYDDTLHDKLTKWICEQ